MRWQAPSCSPRARPFLLYSSSDNVICRCHCDTNQDSLTSMLFVTCLKISPPGSDAERSTQLPVVCHCVDSQSPSAEVLHLFGARSGLRKITGGRPRPRERKREAAGRVAMVEDDAVLAYAKVRHKNPRASMYLPRFAVSGGLMPWWLSSAGQPSGVDRVSERRGAAGSWQ